MSAHTDPHRTHDAGGPASTGNLLTEALDHLRSLLRKEVELAKAEARQSVNRATTGLVLLGTALVLAIVAVNVLTGTLVGAIAAALAGLAYPGIWATLIVGALYILIAYVLVRIGISRLKPENFTANRTRESVKKDAATLKGAIQ